MPSADAQTDRPQCIKWHVLSHEYDDNVVVHCIPPIGRNIIFVRWRRPGQHYKRYEYMHWQHRRKPGWSLLGLLGRRPLCSCTRLPVAGTVTVPLVSGSTRTSIRPVHSWPLLVVTNRSVWCGRASLSHHADSPPVHKSVYVMFHEYKMKNSLIFVSKNSD